MSTIHILFYSRHISQFIFSTDCLSQIFHLDCTRWYRFIFLTHFHTKSQWWWRRALHKLHAYITSVTNPYVWLMVWQWHHFLLASNTREVQPHFIYAKSHYTEDFLVLSFPNCVKPNAIT